MASFPLRFGRHVKLLHGFRRESGPRPISAGGAGHAFHCATKLRSTQHKWSDSLDLPSYYICLQPKKLSQLNQPPELNQAPLNSSFVGRHETVGNQLVKRPHLGVSLDQLTTPC